MTRTMFVSVVRQQIQAALKDVKLKVFPIRVSNGKHGHPMYLDQFVIERPKRVTVRYGPQTPLPCGARVWVEIEVEAEDGAWTRATDKV